MDTESPDHAGLRRSTTEIASDVLDHISRMPNRDAEVDAVRTFGKACYREGVASQSAELATLRGDNAEFQKEVNALAGQVQSLRYWLASGYCDCEDKDVKSSIPDSLEMDWHHEACEYRQRIEIMNGWQEPVEAK